MPITAETAITEDRQMQDRKGWARFKITQIRKQCIIVQNVSSGRNLTLVTAWGSMSSVTAAPWPFHGKAGVGGGGDGGPAYRT